MRIEFFVLGIVIFLLAETCNRFLVHFKIIDILGIKKIKNYYKELKKYNYLERFFYISIKNKITNFRYILIILSLLFEIGFSVSAVLYRISNSNNIYNILMIVFLTLWLFDSIINNTIGGNWGGVKPSKLLACGVFLFIIGWLIFSVINMY